MGAPRPAPVSTRGLTPTPREPRTSPDLRFAPCSRWRVGRKSSPWPGGCPTCRPCQWITWRTWPRASCASRVRRRCNTDRARAISTCASKSGHHGRGRGSSTPGRHHRHDRLANGLDLVTGRSAIPAMSFSSSPRPMSGPSGFSAPTSATSCTWQWMMTASCRAPSRNHRIRPSPRQTHPLSTRSRLSIIRPASPSQPNVAGRFRDRAVGGIAVLEDDLYGLLGFEGEPPRALRADDDQGVIYLGSFSKTIASGLRVGWAIAPYGVREKLVLAAEAATLCPSNYSQLTVSEYLATQPWREQIKSFREVYAAATHCWIHCKR